MLILKPLSIDRSVAGAKIPAVVFIAHTGLTTHELAHMLDSLVGVPRRIGRVWSSSVCRGTARNAARDGNPDRSFRGHKALQPTRVTRYTIEGKQVHLPGGNLSWPCRRSFTYLRREARMPIANVCDSLLRGPTLTRCSSDFLATALPAGFYKLFHQSLQMLSKSFPDVFGGI